MSLKIIDSVWLFFFSSYFSDVVAITGAHNHTYEEERDIRLRIKISVSIAHCVLDDTLFTLRHQNERVREQKKLQTSQPN